MLAELPLTHIPKEDEALRPFVREFLSRTVMHIPPRIACTILDGV